MRPQKGMSLIEVMVALAILGLVIMSSLAVFVERNRRLQQASELVVAYQVLQNESEMRRKSMYDNIVDEDTFLSDTTILAPLKPYTTTIRVQEKELDVKLVTMEIKWRGGKKSAKLELIRTNTGGDNLW